MVFTTSEWFDMNTHRWSTTPGGPWPGFFAVRPAQIVQGALSSQDSLHRYGQCDITTKMACPMGCVQGTKDFIVSHLIVALLFNTMQTILVHKIGWRDCYQFVSQRCYSKLCKMCVKKWFFQCFAPNFFLKIVLIDGVQFFNRAYRVTFYIEKIW